MQNFDSHGHAMSRTEHSKLENWNKQEHFLKSKLPGFSLSAVKN